jgi:hypothetical protein
MYLLSIHIHEYSRILLTKQQISAINIRTNANISFEVLVNIHIREYIFVVFSTLHQLKEQCELLKQPLDAHMALISPM